MMRSLFTGSSGIKAYGQGMNVVSNNLANVNTLGFKRQMMLYQDLSSEFECAASNGETNISQVGHGVRPSATRQIFTEGGFEPSKSATDLAVAGLGFFGVQKNGKTHYTRAGNFCFTKDGTLVDPNGWAVLGRPLGKGAGAGMQAVQLDLGPKGFFSMPGQASSTLRMLSHLGGLPDKAASPGNPFFSLAASWDAANTPPLAQGAGNGMPVKFYDQQGQAREAVLYFDAAGVQNGFTAVEYLLALQNPTDDASTRAGSASAGLLLAGTVSFNSHGQACGLSAFSPPAAGNPGDLERWLPAESENGNPLCTVTTAAGAQTLSLDLGISLAGSMGYGLESASQAASNAPLFYSAVSGLRRDADSIDFLGSSPQSFVNRADGYGPGDLRTVSVSSQGVLSGIYSNGQTQELFQLGLFRFTSQDGLRREGGNHFSASLESGEAEEGIPGTKNFGKLAERKLEQSNVDYAREFTTMIITQRAFQMNSKVVSTSDQMLQRALELKR